MIYYGIVLLFIALIASYFGAGEVEGLALWGAKILFVVGLILILLDLI